ncbi:FRG domain-containing protein [Acidobacteria bacterium AH-259-G07]|nr:FRG domain-containing protein [Acidobacteria bacterium AH-259-G07]
MQEINLNSWEEFEEQIKRLENNRLQQESASKFLYRGQDDHTWSLLTTLEKNWQEEEGLSLKRYHHLIFVVKPQIESFTGVNWNILSYPDQFEKWLNENDTLMPDAFGCSIDFQDTYSYMVYLRHYGFPSPFLDWSSSPYIAAYFAFRQVLRRKDNVSIYVFLESASPIGLKSGCSDKPYIYRFGPYVRTDRRHFLQQSQYTICIMHNGEWQYAPHEDAFALCDTDQDLLWKFNIPYSERLKVLRLLDGYNINALSLFGSEESLMETMSLREINLRDREL